MSLDWRIDGIKDFEELKSNWSLTEALIWATLSVGIGQITERNFEVFHGRLSLIERLNGSFLLQGGDQRYITLEEVKRHIGLWTNATFGIEPKTKWLNRQLRHYKLSMPSKGRGRAGK